MATQEKKVIEVLVVEDNPITQTLLKAMLEVDSRLNFVITMVETLGEAKDALWKRRFDLVLLDLILPDSEPETTFARIKGLTEGIPVIIVTAINGKEMVARALAEGAHGVILKSDLTLERLLNAILAAMATTLKEEGNVRKTNEAY
jgi:CheY-like chemotaxis protein